MFVIVSLGSIILVVGTILLIAFTSLREYIPGYSSTALKRQATELNYKADSLQGVINNNEKYYASIKKVLTGDVQSVEFNRDSIFDASSIDPSQLDLRPTKRGLIVKSNS